jgi:hypothetical protein
VFKRFLIGFAGLFILGSLVYFVGGLGLSTKAEKSEVIAAQNAAKNKENTIKQFKMGEYVEISGVKFKVNFSRARTQGSLGDGEPIHDTFIYIDIYIDKKTNKFKRSRLLQNLKLADSNQKQYLPNKKPSVKKITAEENGKKVEVYRGKLVFDVKLTDHFNLIYDDVENKVRYDCKLEIADLQKVKAKLKKKE